METLRDLPLGAVGACIANSVLWFVPMYILHTICYPWLQSRRIRYDQEHHASLSFSTLFTMDAQLRREWLNSMHVAVGGLGTVVLEKALVELRVVTALPVSTPIDWWLLARQFLVYFVLFDCYYYFLHRFLFHGSWGWKMHKVHHDSHVCAPSTGFSFHWFEGVVTGGIACGLVSRAASYPVRPGMPFGMVSVAVWPGVPRGIVCRCSVRNGMVCDLVCHAAWHPERHGIPCGMASGGIPCGMVQGSTRSSRTACASTSARSSCASCTASRTRSSSTRGFKSCRRGGTRAGSVSGMSVRAGTPRGTVFQPRMGYGSVHAVRT